MNAEPHTHEVKIQRQYDYIDAGGYVVIYGDTHVNVALGPMLERRLRRGVRRAIRKHDRGSVGAGEREAIKQRVLTQAQAKPSSWGAEA